MENRCRFYQTTMLIVLAHEKNTPFDKLIEIRKATMLTTLEKMELLVQEGIFSENDYLQKCNEFKNDIAMRINSVVSSGV